MTINFIEIFINLTLAFLGGLVKKISDLDRNPEVKPAFAYYIVGSLTSMFVGIVVYFLCKNFNISPFLTAGLTSLSGYMGTPVLDLLSNLAQKIIIKKVGGWYKKSK